MIHKLISRHTLDATIEDVWDFFSKPANLNLLTPPSLQFQILSGDELPIYNGQIITYRIRILPLIRVNWVTEIKAVVPLSSFVDVQRAGPYAFWHHHHQFVKSDKGVDIIDMVHYSVGFSFFGEVAHFFWIKRQLAYIFRYRKERMQALIPSTSF